MLLGGQHIAAALVAHRDALVRAQREVPPHFAFVRALVLPPTATLSERRRLGGVHNQQQHEAVRLSLAEVGATLLRCWGDVPPTLRWAHKSESMVVAGLTAAGVEPPTILVREDENSANLAAREVRLTHSPHTQPTLQDRTAVRFIC